MEQKNRSLTVGQLASELELWEQIVATVQRQVEHSPMDLLAEIAALPVRSSRAARSLGAYVSKVSKPVCIRLQFAQEAENLKQTFLHEVAHLCDHLTNQPDRRYRRAHGPGWQVWAKALGTSVECRGESVAMTRLRQQRLRLVAICQQCGEEFWRLRRLNRRQKYIHPKCGGPLKTL